MTPYEIGPYTVTAELKRGPHARLFLADDAQHGHEVVIKLLDAAEYADPTIRARFKLESQLLASLENPAILACSDFGEQDGQLYYVMRWIPGGSLAESLQYGPLPLQEIARILTNLAPGLDAAHALGICHGDIQPANILFDENDTPVLSDFGLANILRAQVSPDSDVLIGPLAYLSPEAALTGANQPGDTETPGCSPASDQYMLGAVLFHMLTGQPPFQAATPLALAIQHHLAALPSVSSLRPGLSPAWDEILRLALAKDPAQRYVSITELATAVSAAAAASAAPQPVVEPVRATAPVPASFAQRAPAKRPRAEEDHKLTMVEPALAPPAPKVKRRRGGLVATFLILLIVLTAAAVFVLTRGSWLPQLLSPVVPTQPSLVIVNPTSNSLNPTSAPLPSHTPPVPTATSLPSPTPLPPTDTPLPTIPLPPTAIPVTAVPPSTYVVQYEDTLFTIASSFHVSLDEMRGMNSFQCDSRLAVGKSIIIPAAIPYTEPASYPPITLRNFTSLALQHIVDCTTNVNALDFSPDGKLLAVAIDKYIYLWNTGDWKPYARLADHWSSVTSLKFSPDGQSLVSGGNDATVKLWQVSDGALLKTFKGHSSQVTSVAFHPGGQQIVSTSRDNTARIWQIDGSLLHAFSGYPTFSAAYTPGGEAVAIGYADSVRFYRLSDLSQIGQFPSAEVVSHLVFSPDGQLLASSSDLWHIGEWRHLYHFQSSDDTPLFTTDGLALFTGRKIWKISNGSLIGEMESPLEESARTEHVWDSLAYAPANGLFAWGTPDGLFILALPANASLAANPSDKLHVVVPGDNIYNLASAYQVELGQFLSLNDIGCDSPIFSGQNLWIPQNAGLKADTSQLPVISAGNVSRLSPLRTFSMQCALTNSDFYFSADSKKLVSGSILWDVPTGSINIQTTRVPLRLDNSPDPNRPSPLLVISPDQRTVAVRTGNDIQLWDIATNRLLRTLSGHQDTVTSLVYSPDGSMLVSSSSTGEQKIIFWNPVDGSQIRMLEGWTVLKLTFTQDGQFLLGGGDDTLRVWSTSDWRMIRTMSGLERELAYSPDASRLAFSSCSESNATACTRELVSLYNVATGTVSWSVQGFANFINHIAFAPDGQTVAAASGNGITIMDVQNGQILHKLYEPGNLKNAIELAYSYDGSLLFSMWENRAIRIWDAKTGSLLHTIRSQPIERMAFSPDNTMLAILNQDVITIWGIK